jgi:hypothetical protein
VAEAAAAEAAKAGYEPVAALAQGTQEAWHAIMQGLGKPSEEKRAQKTREDMVKEQKKMVSKIDEQLEMARNVEMMDIA